MSKNPYEFLREDIREGLLGDLIDQLGGADGLTVREELKKFVQRRPCWEPGALADKRTGFPVQALEFLGHVSIIPPRRFVAKDHFVINTDPDAHVMIGNIGRMFREKFLNGDDTAEELSHGIEVGSHKLPSRLVDCRIIEALGGPELVETKLSTIFALIERQGRGQPGFLLTKGWYNLCFVRGVSGVLYPVFFFWDADGSVSKMARRDRGGERDGKGGGWDIRACEPDDFERAGPWEMKCQVYCPYREK